MAPVEARVIGSKPGSRYPGFNAAVATAVAGGARQFTRLRPWQRVVAPLAGDRVRAIEQFAPHDDATADAGTENHREHIVGTGSRAIARFRHRQTVCHVGKSHARSAERRDGNEGGSTGRSWW